MIMITIISSATRACDDARSIVDVWLSSQTIADLQIHTGAFSVQNELGVFRQALSYRWWDPVNV